MRRQADRLPMVARPKPAVLSHVVPLCALPSLPLSVCRVLWHFRADPTTPHAPTLRVSARSPGPHKPSHARLWTRPTREGRHAEENLTGATPEVQNPVLPDTNVAGYARRSRRRVHPQVGISVLCLPSGSESLSESVSILFRSRFRGNSNLPTRASKFLEL